MIIKNNRLLGLADSILVDDAVLSGFVLSSNVVECAFHEGNQSCGIECGHHSEGVLSGSLENELTADD
jgi:hypothetical protein